MYNILQQNWLDPIIEGKFTGILIFYFLQEKIVPPDPISQNEKANVLQRLNQIIQHRLVTSKLPSQLSNLSIGEYMSGCSFTFGVVSEQIRAPNSSSDVCVSQSVGLNPVRNTCYVKLGR